MDKKTKKTIVLILMIVVLCGIILNRNNEKIDYDYSSLNEESLFYSNVQDVFAKCTQTRIGRFYNGTTLDIENKIYIIFLDKEFNPIPESKINLYDGDGIIYSELEANNDGVIALDNLENDTIYYIKQTQTREGYVLDSQVYRLHYTDTYKSFYQYYFNDTNEISDEEKKDLENEYEKTLQRVTTDDDLTKIESNEYKRRKNLSVGYYNFEYIFSKDDLRNINFNIYTEKLFNDANEDYLKCTLDIEEAEILDLQIEKMYDDNNIVKITDTNNIEKYNGFNNVFLIWYDDENYDDEIRYKLTITFKYNEKIYKFSKIEKIFITNVNYKISKANIGSMEVICKDSDNKPLSGVRLILFKIYDKSGEEELIGQTRTGDDGKISFYMVPYGKYKLVKNYGDENIDEKTIEITNNETVYVEI